jgi:cyclophilin family peptidyl-prolyl cis-trans isomerase
LTRPAPTDLLLSNLTVNESDLIGAPIGMLRTTGSDGRVLEPLGLTYSLVTGQGSEDNSRVRISNGQLQAAEVFDREGQSQLRVRVRVTDESGRSVEKAFTIRVNDVPNPVVTTTLSSPAVAWGDGAKVVDLATAFDDPLSTGQVATFELAPVQGSGGTTTTVGSGQIRVLLYDQEGSGAPLTTANLEAYLTADRYTNTFIHRSVPGFVLQGGGFNLTGNTLVGVTTFDPVANEFSANRSNLRGTMAMAKLGSDPNSATSQWFWSLADNSGNLDGQNGGFTVFGRVLGATDLTTLDAMAAIPVYDASLSLGSSVYDNLPLTNGRLASDNLLRFSSITVQQQAELSYALISNSAPDALEATLEGSNLRLRSLANRGGQATLTLRVTNLLGESVEQTVQVQLQRRPTNQATIRRFSDVSGSGAANLALPTLSGTLAATLQSDERVRILANGQSIGLATPAADRLGWSFRPATALATETALSLVARVETTQGVVGDTSTAWTLRVGGESRLEAPDSELLRVADARPLVVRPTAIGTWEEGYAAWNAGSRTTAGTSVLGTGQSLAIAGLKRYGVSLRNGSKSQVTLELGDGNHAFFLHDAWSSQSAELTTTRDGQGRTTAARFDQISTIRLGNCSGSGGMTIVDLTSTDFITGAMTVVGGNTAGSRNVIWGSAADDTVVCGSADTVICASAGRNTLRLGSGSDRLQYVAGVGAIDRVESFNAGVDKLELWGVQPGTSPVLTLQRDGGNSVLSWESNRITFINQLLTLPSAGSLPSWIVLA